MRVNIEVLRGGDEREYGWPNHPQSRTMQNYGLGKLDIKALRCHQREDKVKVHACKAHTIEDTWRLEGYLFYNLFCHIIKERFLHFVFSARIIPSTVKIA